MKNQHLLKILTIGIAALGFARLSAHAETVWLDSLRVNLASQDRGTPGRNRSAGNNPLSIGGQSFEHGLGTRANFTLYINLKGAAQSFSASVGLDSEVTNAEASVEFSVVGDGKSLWQSGVMKAGDAAKTFSVPLVGVTNLVLKAVDAAGGNFNDHADWGDAKFEMAGDAQPETMSGPPEAAVILTPPAPATPRINNADVFGVRPGSPFLLTIAATGDRPMTFAVDHLPAGLQVDPQSGHITGKIEKAGSYEVTLRAKNARGKASKKFKIICGDQIALTPQMGWNSWNCFAGAVTEEHVKSAADAMVKSGLINHGWTYINVDDYWQNHRNSRDETLRGPFRDTNGLIVPNSRFPDMKGMADYIHSLGLKAGLYSSPGPWTCGGCAGSYQHEEQDAQTYAQWGYDYLKYDLCSYTQVVPTSRRVLADGEKPYQLMGDLLKKQPRDILFSLCQYGDLDSAKWAASVGGNSWRTTGDITDTWNSLQRIAFAQDKNAPYAGPGHWNDPDMLIVGKVGWGNLHPTRLTPNEQYTHISMWCLLAAPLLIGCDMTQLDPFTLNLLENDEVIAIDQDVLGKQATAVAHEGNTRVYARKLADGSEAIGLFNLGEDESPVTVKWSDFGAKGKLAVRDLWRQKDLGKFKDSFTATVPRHGVVLIKAK